MMPPQFEKFNQPENGMTQMTKRVLLSVALLMFGLDVPQAYAQTAGNIYHPLTERCRVADSRATAQGLLLAGGTRLLNVLNNNNYTPQGGSGSSTTCGLPSIARAFAVSVTALPSGTAGYLKIFPAEGDPADGNTVSFASTGTSTNDVIVTKGQLTNNELGVFAHASTHFIVDIVGYFTAPVLELECVTLTSQNKSIVAGAGNNHTGPACAAGFTRTATSCLGNTFNVFTVLTDVEQNLCAMRNTGTTDSGYSVQSRCCRTVSQ